MTQTLAQLVIEGQHRRSTTPRGSLGSGFATDRDPLEILGAQNANRLQSLVPLRWGRMSASPFTFYRGAAALMAHDLAPTPTSGITVQACGDAHLSNFGLYASPERALVFDLNDFDETLPAPWEWDVERLVASAAIAALHRGHSEAEAHEVALTAANGYRAAIRRFSTLSAREIFDYVITVDYIDQRVKATSTDKAQRKARAQELERVARKARSRTAGTAAAKLTKQIHGETHLIDQPPVMQRLASDQLPSDAARVPELYLDSLPLKMRMLLSRYRPVDYALRVVGVGSVGTRCFISLVVDATDDPLILQIKEATSSVLAPYAQPSEFANQGERVVTGQRIMQVVSDPFLGWAEAEGHHFYVRQFRDMKGSFDLDRFSYDMLWGYARLCGAVLARAHAQSCEPGLIAGYLGKSATTDRAFADFAMAYAAQNERDHAVLVEAIRSGRIEAQTDV
ncbi:DUF2252 domain-containing protein [Micropruina sp.]|uniref:DUF2252 domain-containing protein n=1 Tax=Micropruina sp. TaxID=2737536 RepID=UPI0039E65427